MRIPLAEAEARGLVSRYLRSHYRQDFAVFELAELAHIETQPLPVHLVRLREEWDPALVEPITIRQTTDGRMILFDGNHRLTLARERGDETIEAIVQIRGHCRE